VSSIKWHIQATRTERKAEFGQHILVHSHDENEYKQLLRKRETETEEEEGEEEMP
jgi:hypothetical protein